VVHADGLEGAQLDAAVATVAGAVQLRHSVPGQALAALQQGRLVGLDHQQIVGLLAGDQELGGVGVGLERVGGHHHAGQVQGRQQGLEGGDLLGCAADLGLGQHRTDGVVHAGQQVHRAAVTVGWVGAAHRLAVDRHRPPLWPLPLVTTGAVAAFMALAVGQPGADGAGQRVGVQAGQGPANGGLGRRRPVVGGGTAGAQRGPDGLGRVGGPFGDRGHRAGAGQDRGGGQGEDGDQGVAAATSRSRVGDGGEVGQQVRGVGVLELARVGMGEVGEGGWDRDRG
jgi:hypothetical protein